LDHLYSAEIDPAEVLVRIQDDKTISDSVRRLALDFAPLYERGKVHREANYLVRQFEKQNLPRPDLLDAIQKAVVSPAVRREALVLGKQYVEAPRAMHQASWKTLGSRGREPAAYELALRQAEAANRLVLKNPAYRTAVGMANYRLGRFSLAANVLMEAVGLDPKNEDVSAPARLACLAMSHQQLGNKSAASAALADLRELLKLPRWSSIKEAIGLLQEAEALIGSRATAVNR
jgi:tetratricopeptide (TPR) repeat protein